MLTKRTVIGNVVGGAVTALGVVSLVLALGIQQSELNEMVAPGMETAYEFVAPVGAAEVLEIDGDSYSVEILAPGPPEVMVDGGALVGERTAFQATGGDFPLSLALEGRTTLSWFTATEDSSRVTIQNTGQEDLRLTGVLQHSTSLILYTYHTMVIVAGVVIIGFSAGFSIRKPKGF